MGPLLNRHDRLVLATAVAPASGVIALHQDMSSADSLHASSLSGIFYPPCSLPVARSPAFDRHAYRLGLMNECDCASGTSPTIF